jgi:hypothetical protein
MKERRKEKKSFKTDEKKMKKKLEYDTYKNM